MFQIFWHFAIIIISIFFAYDVSSVESNDFDDDLIEYKIVLISKLLQYVDWESFKDINQDVYKTKSLFCVFGDQKKYIKYDNLRNKFVNNYITLQVSYESKIENLKKCDSIFFPKENMQKALNILPRIKMLPIITIGESSLAWQGAMFSIYKKRNHLAFYINKYAIEEAKISINPYLYEIGTLIGSK